MKRSTAMKATHRLSMYRDGAELAKWYEKATQRAAERAAAREGSVVPAEQASLFPAAELPAESRRAYRQRLATRHTIARA
jgi:hypothetical protein